MRRRQHAGEGDSITIVIGKPPRSQLELRQGGAIEKRQPMQISEGLGNLIVLCINDTNSVHRMPHTPDAQCDWLLLSASDGSLAAVQVYLANTTLTPSQTAPIRPVAITVITALNV